MMCRLKIFIFNLLCILLVPWCKVFPQAMPPASASGHITAEVISAFTAVETSQMNFGRFSPGPQGGEIILTPQSTISILGSIYKGPGSYHAASFYVSGDIDATYSISLPAGAVLLTNTSANAKTMKVENWVSIPAPGVGAGKLQDGFQTVYVGATLKVGTIADNPVGKYTGSYIITFDFN
jgi:hypothetical protein